MQTIASISHQRKDVIRVSSNTTCLTEENIVFIKAIGLQDMHIVSLHLKLHGYFAIRAAGKMSYLVNLDDAGKYTPVARRMWREIADMDNTDRMAFIGGHPVAKVLADFIISTAGSDKMRFFSSEQEGLVWLKVTAF